MSKKPKQPPTTGTRRVLPILAREPDAPPALAVRWLVPPVAGPAYAHAMIVGSGAVFTVCKGFQVEGAIYPPAPDVPRCPDCEDGVERVRERGIDGAQT